MGVFKQEIDLKLHWKSKIVKNFGIFNNIVVDIDIKNKIMILQTGREAAYKPKDSSMQEMILMEWFGGSIENINIKF